MSADATGPAAHNRRRNVRTCVNKWPCAQMRRTWAVVGSLESPKMSEKNTGWLNDTWGNELLLYYNMGVSTNGVPPNHEFQPCFPLFSPSILGVKSPYFWVDAQKNPLYNSRQFWFPIVGIPFKQPIMEWDIPMLVCWNDFPLIRKSGNP